MMLTLADLEKEVTALDSEVRYTGNMYLGMMLGDTRDIDAEREWQLLFNSLKDRGPKHGILHKLHLNFGARIGHLLGSEFTSPALNDRPLAERRDVLDRRRAVVADTIATIACVRRLLALHEGTDKTQQEVTEMNFGDMRDSDATVAKVIDGWQHPGKGWSRERVLQAISGPASQQGRVERRIVRAKTTGQLHSLGVIIAERKNLAVEYVKTGGSETRPTTALCVQMAAVHPAYRNSLVPHMIEDLLEGYGECPGNQRLTDEIDLSHKT